VKRKIEQKHSGEAELRMVKNKSGPVITTNCNYILDWRFPIIQERQDWKKISKFIKQIPGVVETGLFAGFSTRAFFGSADGSVFEAAKN